MKDTLQDLIPPEDERRVKALHELKILDTEDEQRFDALIADLAETLDTPIAYLALIDAERQWLKSSVGGLKREVGREDAFCSRVILGNEPVVVPDATRDPRFASSPLVTDDPGLRFYAGVPISDSESGEVIGTVCIADRRSRNLSARELAILEGFANRVASEVNARPMIFVAYAAEDVDWVQRLITRGSALAGERLFDLWSGLRLASVAEDDWKLKDALGHARSLVMLISESFLQTDFVRRESFRLLLRAREMEDIEVLPLLVEPCAWTQIDWLAERTLWSPDGDTAASERGEEGVDELFSRLTAHLQAVAEKKGRTHFSFDVQEATTTPTEVEKAPPSVFLSHASEDVEAARRLAGDLRQAGLDVWLDVEQLRAGDNWMERLEEALGQADAFAVYIGQLGVERWINREVRVALDRNVEDPEFRVIPILGPGADPEELPSFLAQHQWLDLRAEESDPAQIKELVGAILDRPAEAVSLLPPGEAPFRGLLAFEERHSHLFFGRDRETEELLEKLRATPFLAVIGDSGSGKSSLVRAGLIPALHRGRLGQGEPQSWSTLTMRPGKDPFRELANALPDLLLDPDPAQRMAVRQACVKQLASGTDGLCACVGGLLPAGRHTLLVVDQFEEVFTQSDDEAERHRFIDTLLNAGDASGDRPLHVVITLRADFYSECFEHPRLPEVISKSQYPVRAIGREALREVIEKPAAMAGVRLEAGLLDAMLHDLGEESASLALLEHMLLELWKSRRSETLTHACYEKIGRVQGALEHHAEAVFGALDEAQQGEVRKLMLHLAVPGAGSTVTRRRIPWQALAPEGAEGERPGQVLRHLVDQRLLTVRQGAAAGGAASVDEVEVAHEALLRGWNRLRGWLDEDREFLLWRQRTATAFFAWEESERDPGALLRGGPLAEARRWYGERAADMTEAGREFIAASLARARRNAWLKRAVVGTIAALAVVAAGFGLVARAQRRQALDALEVATLALQQVGEMSEVTGQAKAEQPEALELKRGIAERAVSFYQNAGDRRAFSADLQLREAVAHYRLGNILSIQREEGAAAAAATAHEKAVEILEDLGRDASGDDPVRSELAKALYWRGYGRFKAGDLEAAEADYRRALEIQRPLAAAPAGETAEHSHLFEAGRTLNGLGVTLKDQRRWDEARAAYEEANQSFGAAILQLPPGAPGGDLVRYRQGLAWSLTNLAELHHSWGRALRAGGEESLAREKLEESESRYREVIPVLEDLESRRRDLRLELAVNHNNLANLLMDLDRYEEARAASDEAVAIFEELAEAIPDIRNELGNSYITRGSAFWVLEQDDRARETYAKARRIYDQLADPLRAEGVPQYRWRRALALAGLAELGDADARLELCRLLPALPRNQGQQLEDLCP